jgi:hypothetical protein
MKDIYGFEGPEVPTERTDYKALSKYAGNQHKDGFKNPDRIDYGQPAEARKGASFGKKAGPATAAEGHNVESGKRSWKPSATENYVGNPDKIQDRQLHNRKGNLKG